jgi:hypothetical protein
MYSSEIDIINIKKGQKNSDHKTLQRAEEVFVSI